MDWDDVRHFLALARTGSVRAAGAFSSLTLLVQAARQGMGLAMLPTYVGDPQPELQRLSRPDLRHVADLWLLSHPDLRDNARLRAARAAIAQVFKREEILFRGDRSADAPVRPDVAPDGSLRPPVR